jgi:Ni/Co efflux regulator RcnB
MKRLILAAAAVAALAGPVAFGASSALAQGHHEHGGGDRGDHGGNWDRGNRGDRGDRGGNWDRGNRGGDRGGWDRGNRGGEGRWDGARHNGYYYNNRWSYGPPPQAYYGRPGFRPGYSSWRRGGYLPPYYRDRGYVISDYERYHLRRPPRGYYWYRAGDDYLLAAVASGLIFDVIANGDRY